jgi:hypothetical protein
VIFKNVGFVASEIYSNIFFVLCDVQDVGTSGYRSKDKDNCPDKVNDNEIPRAPDGEFV